MLTDSLGETMSHYVRRRRRYAWRTSGSRRQLMRMTAADPEDDGEHRYYFDTKGKKAIPRIRQKINGKTYYFDDRRRDEIRLVSRMATTGTIWELR
ncbi:MAG: hypothetical protein ACLR8P_16555 [Clostridium fessum]